MRDNEGIIERPTIMGTGIRVFLVDEHDSLQRLSLARLERLLHFDRGESLPQYSGKRIGSGGNSSSSNEE